MSLLLIIGLLVFFLFHMILNHFFPRERHLPPGPTPWPFIGNLFQIRKNAHVHLAKMTLIHGPIMSIRLGHRTMIVGSSSVAACEILKTHDHALSGRDVSILLRNKKPTIHNMNLVFTSECDDGWRVLRNIYGSELFSSKALESRAKMRETKVMEMVEYLASKEGEDIVIKDVVFATAINIIGNTTLSIDLVDFEGNGIGACIMESVRKLTKLAAKPQLVDMFPILGQWDLQGWYKEIMHIVEKDLGSIWKDSLEKKRSGEYIFSGSKDFTDVLIDKGFTNQQINPLMQEIFAAGTETTTLTIEWLVSELFINQDAMQKAKDEITQHIHGKVVKDSDLGCLSYLEACYKETLRLHPPGPFLVPRKSMQTCEVMGYTIPKDSQIMVNVWAISHDPNIWDDPFSFKPERFMGSNMSYKGKDFEFLPFGSGRRMCPGESMASKTILLIVASLVRNFNWFLPDNMNPNTINMDEELDIVLHKKQPLHVKFKLNDLGA